MRPAPVGRRSKSSRSAAAAKRFAVALCAAGVGVWHGIAGHRVVGPGHDSDRAVAQPGIFARSQRPRGAHGSNRGGFRRRGCAARWGRLPSACRSGCCHCGSRRRCGFSARLIDPTSARARLANAVWVLTALVALQIAAACSRQRGCAISVAVPIHSLRWRSRRERMRERATRFTNSSSGCVCLIFSGSGLRGFLGATAWLALPVTMLASASRLPPGLGPLVGLIGGGDWHSCSCTCRSCSGSLRESLGCDVRRAGDAQPLRPAPIAFLVALVSTARAWRCRCTC